MKGAEASFDKTKFVCPSCQGELSLKGASLKCCACGRIWPSSERGVWDFRRRKDRYWGEYPQRLMEALVARSGTAGWQAALKEFFSEKASSYYDYILGKKRADWHFLVPVGRDARILDAGCGWGTLSFELARTYDEVVAFDAVKERTEFINVRREAESINNLLPVCGEVNSLPFPNDYFDMAVLNGVLEWVPTIEEGLRPLDAQIGALKETARVLKKGGYLYLAIENRWAAINFLGSRDTHSGLRFAPLLPRFLADLYSRLARGKTYREYTHTYRDYKTMLRKAGFSDIRFYAPLPSYRNFYYITPVDDMKALRFFLQNLLNERTRLRKVFAAISKLPFIDYCIRFFVPDFSIIAKR